MNVRVEYIYVYNAYTYTVHRQILSVCKEKRDERSYFNSMNAAFLFGERKEDDGSYWHKVVDS